MRIEIASKLRPFSHRPGSRFLVPYTTWEVQVFPALLRFQDLAGNGAHEVVVDVQGPVKGFTALLDLEKGRIEVFGRGKKGYFRTFIEAGSYPFLKRVDLPKSQTRLSFGVHKKQDFDMALRRMDPAELFPFWVRLAQLVPEVEVPKEYPLCEDLIELFQVGFVGVFSPRLVDENHLGILPEKRIEGCPLGLLHEGARIILSFLFQDKGEAFSILPNLPKQLHAGRLIRVVTKAGDEIDLEWSKKSIKKMVVRPATTREVVLELKKGIRSFRVRKTMQEKGVRQLAKESLAFQANQRLLIDRFMF